MTKEEIGNHILNGCLMISTNKEVGEHLTKLCVGIGYLEDWYMASIDAEKSPRWTLELLEELFNDFYLIPKTKED